MIPTQSVTIEEIEDDDSTLYDKLKQVKLDPMRDLLKQHDLRVYRKQNKNYRTDHSSQTRCK